MYAPYRYDTYTRSGTHINIQHIIFIRAAVPYLVLVCLYDVGHNKVIPNITPYEVPGTELPPGMPDN